jgi:hypothetical protein
MSLVLLEGRIERLSSKICNYSFDIDENRGDMYSNMIFQK